MTVLIIFAVVEAVGLYVTIYGIKHAVTIDEKENEHEQ